MAQSIAECVRGFSFMPENKVDVINLQYIEGGELSRAWKMSRRERLKTIEAKIWDEFINERDMVESVATDDPYQFLEQLPDDCMRELMDTELKKMQDQMSEDIVEQHKEQDFKDTLQEPRETLVTFAQSEEDEQCEMITILDDDEDEASEAGRDMANESIDSPCTVREKPNSTPDLTTKTPDTSDTPDKPPPPRAKSPENVTSLIETSIYTAKVKELQSKVNLELLAVITTLEVQNLSRVEPHALPKLQKQCAEFCARYCRIYLYPMSRQIHDITRHNNNNAALPFARHTHTRSQMIRAVSLQQNLLQSLQVFHKWFAQKTPLRDCVASLRSFIQLVREGDAACPAEVHNEELLHTCGSLNETLDLYLEKISIYLKDDNTTTCSRLGVSMKPPVKKTSRTKYGGNTKADTEAKLSMYSLDTFRLNNKCSSTGRSSGGTSKARISDPANNHPKVANVVEPAHKKTNRSRRPLMRAPVFVQRREKQQESDNITTLVEGVDVGSARGSAPSPAPSSAPSPRAPHAGTRQYKKNSPRKAPIMDPRKQNSKVITERELKLALNTSQASEDSLPSVIKVQCARKDSPVAKTPSEETPRFDPSGEKLDDFKKEEKEVESPSDVSSLLRRLCAGQATSRSRRDRLLGSKNAQLLCVNGGSPRQPTLGTPQLLRILEETIQKQAPKPQFYNKPPIKDVDRFRLSFNTTNRTAEALFQYRTKFVQHMLTSPMYANSAVGKPWEMIGNVSEKIIDDILLSVAKEMQLENIVDELYKTETQ